MRPLTVRLSVTVTAAFAALAIAAPAAGASLLNGCPDAGASQPFQPWGDDAMYVLAPDGGLEQGGGGWDLDGGAVVVAGNESFQVGGAGDSWSLSLPDDGRATTADTCIGLDSPTMRFFARNDGDPDGRLVVSVIVDTLLGPVTLPIGSVAGTDAWRPTPAFLLLANLTALPIVNDGTASIRLRFTPHGGDWRIDDVYVDPWKGR
ncbi:MAG TPA: hypothetical protein VFI18_02210 [Gaiellales bacterium]|nr:hypothetical protein [Gaiellales bacterium]